MKIIADGDSWFDFPKWLFTGGSVIDHLENLSGWNIENLANAGDATQEMLSLGQREKLESSLRGADYLLFSGGGNDIAGRQLVTLLNQNHDGDVLKAINFDRLRAAMDMVMAMYDDLAEIRDEVAPDCTIVTHEYDFAIPRQVGILWMGPWLKPSMDYCGWKKSEDQSKIAQMILHDFAVRMRNWKIRGHLHVRTQGTVHRSEWHDEMHLSKSGLRKVAMKFYDSILDHREHRVKA